MTGSMNYYPHRLLDYNGENCDVIQDAATSTELSTSIAMLLIALAASEVAILALCKAMAWYADVVFYSQDWTSTEADKKPSNAVSPETIAQSLNTFKYEPRPCVLEEECTCPICLVDFEPGDSVSHGKASCHHRFHEECISQWLSKQASCPCCRKDMIVATPPTIWQQGGSAELDPHFCLFVF